MLFEQQTIQLPAFERGFHIITHLIEQVLPIHKIECGLLHVFIQHTSASLSINENADPTVRLDFEQVFNRLVKENEAYYLHTDEGTDDLPAHIKASLLGSSVTIPVQNGRLALGLWQGVYLGEHRNHAAGRKLLVTIHGV